MEQEIGTWDSVLLENLSEDSFINNIHQRYKRDHIYVSPTSPVKCPHSNAYIPFYRPTLELLLWL